jgi:hypothetical protein
MLDVRDRYPPPDDLPGQTEVIMGLAVGLVVLAVWSIAMMIVGATLLDCGL